MNNRSDFIRGVSPHLRQFATEEAIEEINRQILEVILPRVLDLDSIGVDIAAHAALTETHGATGAIVGTINTQTLTNKTLTTPAIGDFTNATHAHANAAGGGTIAHTALTSIGTNTHAQIDTAVTNSVAHIAATSAHGSSGAVIGTTTLAADIATHAALTVTHGATGAVVGTTNTQTLSNKTLTTPTIADFTNAAHTHTNAAGGGQLDHTTALTNIGTNSHATIDSHIANTATAHGATGAVVGTTNAQTLTNKTLTAPVLGGSATGTYTLAGTPTITSPAISGPTLSGTVAGTYTIGGTPTFPSSVVLLTGAQTLVSKTLTTPTIADFTNATHTHAGASTGGTIAHTALTSIGTNTHAQIDTHITSLTDHGMAGSRLASNATTTLATAQDTAISVTVGSGETWYLDFNLLVDCSSTGGIKIALGGTATASSVAMSVNGNRTSTVDTVTNKITALATLNGSALTTFNTGGSAARFTGSVVTSGAGTLLLQHAVFTGGQTSTIYAGSILFAKRIA